MSFLGSKEEGRRKKEEGRKKREEERRKREEGRKSFDYAQDDASLRVQRTI